MVFDRQQVLRLLLEPAGTGQGLALGTVTVATRVVGDALVAAVQAVLDVAAQRRGPADGQVAQRLALHGGQPVAVTLQECLAVVSNDVRHFPGRPRQCGGHGRPSGGAGVAALGSTSRSSRLGVWCKRSVRTCRYRVVVSSVRCPSSILSVSRSTPASNRCVA